MYLDRQVIKPDTTIEELALMFGKAPKAVLSAAESIWTSATAIRAEALFERNVLKNAAKNEGMFGLGESTAAQAEKLGRAWVGDGARVASDGKTLISSDGLRQYRPPSSKRESPLVPTGVQANLESRPTANGKWTNNGHLDIIRK